MDDEQTCPECGSPLPGDAPGGLCPKCLLQAGFPSGGRHLHIRCPHCHEAVELVDDAALVEITCPTCDSRFSLVDQETLLAEADAPGRIGRFQLLAKLGVGAFGSVWRARDPELDRDVAVKIPRKEQLTAAETEMFVREARSAAQLRHPNVVQVHEVGRENGRVYIVSDLVEGITLADRLTAGRPSHRESAELVRKMAGALAAAHVAGVIHRDLKPSNVLLDERGEPHVTDFGLAKRDAGEITMTIEGRILGTPAYMSPEQAKGDGHFADARSDVYSLGAMFFELLTGEKPFRGNTTMLLHQVIHDDPPRPRKLDGAVPRDLETIALKCLEKDPARRYQTARELADDLGRFLADDPIRARPLGRLERTRRWCRRNRVVALLGTAVVLSLLIGLATTLWQWRHAQWNLAAAELARTEEAAQRELALQRGEETKLALDDSQTRLARLFVERGTRDLDADPHAGMPWFLEAYRTAAKGSDEAAMHRLRMGLMIADVPHLARFWPGARDATFSSDGKRFAVAVGTEAFVFELPSLLRVGPFPHEWPVVGVDFSPDGERLVTRTLEQGHRPVSSESPMPTRVWNARTAEPLGPSRNLDDPRVTNNGGASIELQFTPDGEQLLAVKYGMMNRFYTRGSFRLFDARTLEPIGTGYVHHHEDEWFEYVVAPDRHRILFLRGFPYTGDEDRKANPREGQGPIHIVDVTTGEPTIEPLDVPILYYAADAEFSADGSRVLIGGNDGAYLFDAASGDLMRKFPVPAGTSKVLFHPDGKRVVVTDADDVHVFDRETAKIPNHGRWKHERVFRLDPTGSWFVLGDGTIAEWKVDGDGPRSSSFPKPHSVVFSGDGSRFLSQRAQSQSGASEGLGPHEVLRSHDAYPLVPPWRFDEGHLLEADVFSRDGRFHAQKHDVGIWLWDLDAQPRVLRPFGGLEGTTVRDAALDEAGERLVVLAADGEVSLWDAVRGTAIGEPFRPDGDWQRLVVHPAGDRVALVGGQPEKDDVPEDAPPRPEISLEEFRYDGGQRYRNVQVWEPATGRAVTPVLLHRCVSDLRFTPDGRQLAVVANYNVREERPTGRVDRDESELTVWSLDSGRAVVEARRSEGEHQLLGFTDGGRTLVARIERVVPGPEPGTRRSEFEQVAWRVEDWRQVDVAEQALPGIDEIALERLVPRLENGRVVVYDDMTGERLIDLEGNVTGRIEAWATTPDRRRIAVGFRIMGWPHFEFQIRQWDLRTGESRGTPVSERRAGRYEPLLAYRPDGRVLAVADSGHLRLWDARSGLPLTAALPFVAQWSRGTEGPYSRDADANALRFTPDGTRLTLARHETVWTLPLGDLAAAIPADDELAAWSRVLSAHRIDQSGGYVPLTAEEIVDAVAGLRRPE